MSRIFITASFQNTENKAEIEQLCALVNNAGFEDFCFIRDVEHYQHVFDSPKDLMERTLEEIKLSEYLLIDVSDKPTGRAYEAGMAFTLGKKVIVIMKKGTKIKATTRGIAHVIIEYTKLDEIVPKLKELQ